MHLDDFGLLLYLTQHLGILYFCLEGIFDSVIGASKGLVFRQVVLGVLVPTQVLVGIFDATFSFLEVVLLELGYTCLEVILGELPAEAPQCIKAESVDLSDDFCIHLMHLSSPRIVFLLLQNVLNQLIIYNISAQLYRLAKPSGRLTFFVEEGLVDGLAEHF